MKISTIIYIAIAIIVFVVLALYEALRTKKKDVNDQSPFKELIGKTLTLKRDVVFAKNIDAFYLEELHFITEDEVLFDGVQKIDVLPKGTKIKIESVTFHTNGTSGSTTSNIVGTVFVKALNKEMKFEYSWGKYHLICLDEPCDYWLFPKAVWQDNEDTKKYFIK
jgi:hypothetical protein